MDFTPIPLEPSPLMEAASEQCGFDDFGDPRMVEGLTAFLDALNAEANPNPMGCAIYQAEIIGTLSNRLRFEHDLKSDPTMLDGPILKPLFILGLPRTGTTKLHCMIAADPTLQSVATWQTMNPAPLPGQGPADVDQRIAIAKGAEGFILANFPALMAGHSFAAEDPQEEIFMARLTFEDPFTLGSAQVPSYRRWLAGRPRSVAYQYMKRVLQYLQWQAGGPGDRAWVLKSPAHLGNLDLLLDLFPDATFVQCHRDPTVAVPSLCRLVELGWESRGNEVRAQEAAEYVFEFFGSAFERHAAQRAEFGDRLRIIDVMFDDIVRDPHQVIARIYGAWGRELTRETETKMRSWETQNPANKYGKHEYSLERYGLAAGDVVDRFRANPDRLEVGLAPNPTR